MKYQVTIVEHISYDVEVEAESFAEAVAKGEEVGNDLSRKISETIVPIVPDEILVDYETEVSAVYKLNN